MSSVNSVVKRVFPGRDASNANDLPPTPTQDLARPRRHESSTVYDWDPVHDDIRNPLGVVMRILERADIANLSRIEDGDVRDAPVAETPMVGEPEYDIPPFLWNPLGSVSTRARTERRIRAFADAGLDGDRIRTWAIVRGVMLGLPSAPGRRIEADRAQFRVVRELL